MTKARSAFEIEALQAAVARAQDELAKLAEDQKMPRELPVPGTSWYLDETFITWDQYAELVPGVKVPAGKGNHPVTHVSWWDAARFCNLRSVREGLQPYYTELDQVRNRVRVDPMADGYRLPDEDLYEKAMLAGSPSPYCCPEAELPQYAHFNADGTAEVKSKKPNAWGFHDPHGNVWCWMDNPYRRRHGS